LDLGLIHLETRTKVQIGQTAPAFTIDTLDGSKVSLADYRGKFLLLNFWIMHAQTQPEADKQMDKVRQLYQAYGDDERFDILGVTMTHSIDLYVEIANKYLAEKDITWKQGTLGFENQDLMRSYGVTSYPFNVLIDPNGTVLATGIDGEQLEQTVAEALQP
jgi:cytochrome oxidase Cu insertion factor (SCO1/SenC/PrrC family)